MKRNEKTEPRPKRDLLDELIENGDIDEVGLLDLVFVEEILHQNKTPSTTHLY